MTSANHPEPNRKTGRRINVELYSAITAIVLSALSIVVAYRSELTQREMLAASVWPHLQFGHGNVGDDGVPRIAFQITNVGTGPARVVDFQIFDEQRPVTTVSELLKCCTQSEQVDLRGLSVVSTPVEQPVLPANDGLSFFQLQQHNADPELWEALNKRRFRMWARVCYCSVLNDCWELDSRQALHRPVQACSVAERSGFNARSKPPQSLTR